METAAIILSLAATSCALTLDGPKPRRARIEVPRCDTGKGLVAIDGVAAGLSSLGAAIALDEEQALATVLATGLAITFVASAVSGHRRVDRCRAAFGEYEAAIRYTPPTVASPTVASPAAPPAAPPAASPPVVRDEEPVETSVPEPEPDETADPWRDFWTVSP